MDGMATLIMKISMTDNNGAVKTITKDNHGEIDLFIGKFEL